MSGGHLCDYSQYGIDKLKKTSKSKMKYFQPKKIIIENPHKLEVCRFNINNIISEAINVKQNFLNKDGDFEIAISRDVKIINEDKTITIYKHKKGIVEVATEIIKESLTIKIFYKKNATI